MIEISNSLIYTTDPTTYKIHRLKNNPKLFFERGTLLTGETISDFEEVAITNIQNIINNLDIPKIKISKRKIESQNDLFDKIDFMFHQRILDITLKGNNDFIFKEGNNIITVPAGQTRYQKVYIGSSIPQINLFYDDSFTTELVRVDAQPNGFNYELNTGDKSADALEYMCAFYTKGTSYPLKSNSLLNFDGIYLQPSTSHSCLFYGELHGDPITFPAADFDFRGATTLQNLFHRSYKIKDFGGLEAKWDLSTVTNIIGMFQHCTNLTSLDVSNWDISNVTSICNLFQNCANLTSLDVSNWDTSSVTDMNNVFQYCYNLESPDVSNWDTSNVIQMSNLFGYCYKITSLDISDWDMSNVTTIAGMFSEGIGMSYIDLNGKDLSSCTTMSSLTSSSRNIKTVNFTNTLMPNLQNVSNMFGGYSGVVQVLGSIDMTNVTNGTGFYNGATGNLRRLHLYNLGRAEGLTSIMINARYWGINTSEILDADQSLQDTIDDSYDRATAGYSACTITLHSNTKTSVLTESQIAEWTAKGFTLA